jgi:hypothetical protein
MEEAVCAKKKISDYSLLIEPHNYAAFYFQKNFLLVKVIKLPMRLPIYK